MELKPLLISAYLFVAIVVSHAALPSVVYWNSQLPGSTMPKVVKDLLKNEWLDDKSAQVVVGKGGVGVHTGKGTNVGVNPGGVGVHTGSGTNVGVNPGGVGVHTGSGTNVGVNPGGVGVHTGSGTNVGVNPGGVGVNTGSGTNVGVSHGGGVAVHTGKGTNVGVSHGGVHVYAGHKGRPVYVGVTPGPNPFDYNYAATKTQLHDNPNVALFFLEKDLHQGKTLNLEFVKTENRESLLPRKVAESIPFSSKYTPEIFDKFSVEPKSKEAEIIKNTIQECEESGIKGEEKYCATSLESMIDFSVSKLGKNIQAVSTDAHQQFQKQKYTISGVKKVDRDDEAVVCHKQNYPYAVFYCHTAGKTKAYSVNLVGENGKTVEAVAICHEDTSAWNPKHLAFQVLNVKPGTVPVCHFLPENHIVWVRK